MPPYVHICRGNLGEEKLVSLSSLRPVFLISMESDLAALNGHVTWIAPLSP